MKFPQVVNRSGRSGNIELSSAVSIHVFVIIDISNIIIDNLLSIQDLPHTEFDRPRILPLLLRYTEESLYQLFPLSSSSGRLVER